MSPSQGTLLTSRVVEFGDKALSPRWFIGHRDFRINLLRKNGRTELPLIVTLAPSLLLV